MAKTSKSILVTGPTRGQGAAAAAYLLADGWQVRALTRDPSSAAAQALARAGAEIVAGDMHDRASLDAAAQGVHGVFSVQPAWDQPVRDRPGTAIDEVRLGVNVADAARAADIEHFVYTSVGGAERGFATDGGPVQIIAVDDIGAFAALAFARPEGYLGKEIEIAGDELTARQILAVISRATGRSIEYRELSLEAVTQFGPLAGSNLDDLRAAYLFATDKGGWQADIPTLRTLHPGLMDFETWLARQGRAKIEELFRAYPA
ncbi:MULTISPECIES: NmrA family NAD(P)-binding protein [Protofrankia]|uniref:NmrA family protein n=1 Tax=Candidatus Protofrankia datiscae TaxID=2716812 RepID=F8AXT8_9ACTN|nr:MULTISPECIES: NmrA family NAD(P)-binding protein [Protofrankia]AEH11506.1 NmrA family protein [Candidatus Protofrankia datiscae]